MAGVVVQLVGYGATAVACVQLVPQVTRTVTTRRTAGVSPMMWALLCAQGFGWIGYGVRASLVPPVLTNVVALTCAVVLFAVLKAEQAPGVGRALAVVALAAMVVVAVIVVFPNGVLGALAALLSASVTWPQAVAALRTPDLSGLSRSSWAVGIAASSMWALYGAANGSLPMVLASIEGMVLALVVLARIMAFERRVALVQPLESATRSA